MAQSRNTNFILMLVATAIGGLISCFMLLMGIAGYSDLNRQELLNSQGVIGTAEVVEIDISTADCYQVKYQLTIDGVGHLPEGIMGLPPDSTDCLATVERVQAEKFGTIQVVYLADQPEISQPAGPVYFSLGISQFLTTTCLGGGALIPLALLLGWWLLLRSKKEPDDSQTSKSTNQEEQNNVYPLFSQYETLGQKIAIVDGQLAPTDQFDSHLATLQTTYDEIDQWVVVEHFGRTPLNQQKVTARVLSESKVRKPTIEAVTTLVQNIASHPDYKPEPLQIKFGLVSFEVKSTLEIPLIPLLSKALPKEEYLILSNRTEEIAGFQVQSLIFPSELDQRVEVIRHPRYPTSGRYPSVKVLDMIQAEAQTNMHLQLVVPRKEGRGQKFEVHSSYQTVPTAGLSASAMFAIARAIHAAGLASDEIQLADYPSNPILSVTDDLKVTVKITPDPQLTRVEYTTS